MLNRRHFRVKVMQTIYAMHQHESDSLDKEEKFLFQSIENSQDLYLLMIALFDELQLKERAYLEVASKKHLATKAERNPNLKFVNNSFFKIISNNSVFYDRLEERKITNWKLNDDCVLFVLEAIKDSELYKRYMSIEEVDFRKDILFMFDIFNEVIAPNEKLYDYLEDYKITWVDDIPVINTLISKQIKSIKSADDVLELPNVFKDLDDKEFVRNLFRKTVLNELEFAAAYENKTPNWDKERIAELDTIILKMAICELLKFPSIPVKVTMNEYLEIAKEYSTPKSSIFINGILDNLVKEFQTEEKIKKTGRGLL
ncbi:transcription antitermination factor NusB [Flavobacterium urocaniciphilum]|uniref:NusB antitermination factor n=1 Tax=Flavobacterium urocaniciphilum TaxID=1299341 RepID=A0A1H8YR13_9FLAO|nr:transcription antitermination factor NusB [Flavobacterium urocaniciphilum]SEP54654.1 NusB antitermination factor [Flavobacterium urocaniciphilum]